MGLLVFEYLNRVLSPGIGYRFLGQFLGPALFFLFDVDLVVLPRPGI